ncbi:MAG: DEAD/DEAH box helicase, partial [Candidatus Marinimicrobia bacterium]|nr:DEAD/DEAH box helicase [Candidatus Neomarinimicrobiota bacterium]
MVSRETIVGDCDLFSVFQNKLFDDFQNGTPFGQLTHDAAALFLCVASNKLKSNILLSFKNEKAAYSFYLLAAGLEPDRFLFYPAADLSEKVPGFNIESERYREEALIKLEEKNRFHVCVTTTSSLKEKNISIGSSSSLSSMSVYPGNKIDRDDVINRLRSWGFKKTDTVAEPKDFAWRGDILDVFPIYFRRPVRVVFNFDQVENVFIFDPLTQLTTKTLARLNIKGFSSVDQADDYIGLVDYTRSSTVVKCLHHGDWVELRRGPDGRAKNLMCLPIDFKNHLLTKRIAQIKNDTIGALDNLFVVGNENEKGLLGDKFKDATWISGNLQKGFFSPFLKIVVLSSSDILNEKRSAEKWAPKPLEQHKSLTLNDISNLGVGDYVVHRLFGVGVFLGLTIQNDSVGIRESLEIEYANNARVFVSIEKMDLIHQYVGSKKDPTMSSLGSKKWLSDVSKTRKAVRLVAKELIELYANKKKKRLFRYSLENDLDGALAASFPFVETLDQKRAIKDVLSDMDNENPVDRLVCGDVGFGKTEVALRAIMKSVLSNKQSVFLCPTTILADQHFITCTERLEPLGIKTGLLSRFKTKKEQLKTLSLLQKKEIDVLIGTHRILSQDVVIPELGLLVVDEEHRFGVSHKEKIRSMKQQLDVLTLSATPIPRTLQQSLVGIRDVSLIQTPPKSRKPIETTVRYFDWDTVAGYIERELSRGGQVYFLHNRVDGLSFITHKLRTAFPRAIVENIHGQMSSKELESKVLSFFNGGIDILACTTIIESGLDVTNANCIIVNDAQNFGLSQLYQIRGRVGRGQNQAHCLLLVPRKQLEQGAHRRLKTLEQYTSLGSGYDISVKDLEIRGAGSLFGYKQSGHISSVGFEMYCNLLKSEVDLVVENSEDVRFPSIVFGEDALINESYIENPTQRLEFYNHFSRAKTTKDVLKIKHELNDRFGNLPVETKNLLFIAKARVLFKNTSVSKVSIDRAGIVLVLGGVEPYP